jgi:hypothetical protein
LALLELLANHTGFASFDNCVTHSYPTVVLSHGELSTSLSLVTQVDVVLEVVDTGGWCANNLGMGPEYPVLDESAEYARWRILHWITSLD